MKRPIRTRITLPAAAPKRIAPILLLALTFGAQDARAEGTTELGARQNLQTDTTAYVDIVSASTERIQWTGTGTMTVKSPSGATVATLSSGASTGSLSAHGAGAYTLTFSAHQVYGTSGTGHIICDLNGDGDYDITSDDDLHLLLDVAVGDNSTVDLGRHRQQRELRRLGTYNCVAMVTVGEFHYVGLDIETCYEGFRLFLVDASLEPHRPHDVLERRRGPGHRRADAQATTA
jgi:hypothetical protein